MVVLILIGLVSGTVISQTDWKTNEVKQFHKDFGLLSRNTFLKARLKNTIYRVVFKIPERRENSGPISIKVELQSGQGFSKDEGKLTSSMEFPKGIEYKDFLSNREENSQDAMEEETTDKEKETSFQTRPRFFYKYVYFLPQGFVSPVAIHVEQNGRPWTLTIEALTGKVQLLEGHRTLESLASL